MVDRPKDLGVGLLCNRDQDGILQPVDTPLRPHTLILGVMAEEGQ